MALTILDNDEVLAANPQSIWMQTDVDTIIAGFNGTYVVSGGAVTAQGTPDMTVAVATGTVAVAGAIATLGAGNVTIDAADATNPRVDLIWSDETGTRGITVGTAAANPKAPALPASKVLLAMVYVPANDTDIDADQITDKRVIVPHQGTSGTLAKFSGGTTLINSILSESGAVATVAGSGVITQGTITTAVPNLSGTVTWNDAGVTFTGWKLDVTSTLSASASKLIDLQVGSVSQFSVSKDGVVNVPVGGNYSQGGVRILFSTDATDSVFVGYRAGGFGGTTSENTFVGYFAGSSATGSGTQNTIIGSNAGSSITTAFKNIVIGRQAGNGLIDTANEDVIIGNDSFPLSNGSQITGIGDAVGTNHVAGNGITLIGNNADAIGTLSFSIAIGMEAKTTASNQLVFGSTTGFIADAYIGAGVTSVSPGSLTIQNTGGSGTNNAGGDLILAAGKGTGTAIPRSLFLATSTVLGTGTTLQTLSNRWQVSGPTVTGGNPGDLLAVTDGGVNIGGVDGTKRPDKVIIKTSVIVGGNTVIGSVAGKLNAALLAIASQAIGDLLYADSTTTFARLGAGAVGTVFSGAGAGVAPTWSVLANTVLAIPGTNLTASGPQTSAFQAGGTITAGNLVILNSSSQWVQTDANAAATYNGLLGVSLESKTVGEAMLVALPGSIVRNTAWAWTPGATLYLSETAATITETQPVTTDAAIRVVGHAVDADDVYFLPSPDWITHV